ncbi:MAG: CehA/McbA family metallohydrolase [Cyclobacteriaceae bacterium]
MEEDTRKITPVMVCITNVRSAQVHVPPYGEIAGIPTEVELFMTGVDFKSDKNWVGPIRMTNGRGNNKNRSGLYELLPSIPHWREPVMYQTSGDFTIDLPPGAWRISLEHGNEYIPVTEEFVVSADQKRLTKTFLLKRWINLPERGWYSGDVHVHHPTNKPQFRKYLLEYAKAEDVHLVNMLEMGHHLGTDFKLEGFGKKYRVCKGTTCLVSGQEDPRSAYGHIIGLNITHQERDTSVYHYYELVFKKLHQQPGSLIGYAHFSWRGFWKGFAWHITTGEIDFVELLQFLRLNTVDYYDYLNLGFRITAAAGSDFPWASTIGDVRTFVYTGKTFSADAWFEGLKAGHTFVTNGPALFFEAGGKLPGTEIVKPMGSSIELKAKAISNSTIGQIDRIAIYNNDGLVIEKINTEKRDSLDITLVHTLNKSQWVAAVIYCNNGAVAHTTPMYVVIDGKPTWDKEKASNIIKKQMEAIQVIEDEEKTKKPVDQGILTRLESAQQFYQQMLQQINNEK